MYEFIKGKLVDKTPTKAIVETEGIGYRLLIGLNTFTRLPESSQNVILFLSQVVREDSNTLYAFIEKEERDLFESLITVSGIGPKTGLAILGHIEMHAFLGAIQTADTRLISKIPGIGKKTAERLVIEMRDKVKARKENAPSLPSGGGLFNDAISALLNLGIPLIRAQKAIEMVRKERSEESDLGKIITHALQKI